MVSQTPRWFDDEREIPAWYGRLRGRVRGRDDGEKPT
ncbi:UNVERIFIED_ORG: hypothetical protein FHR35_000516 [Microbispora rosea subsp. rosea]